jgi:DNA-binding MarR family transcriptional regulator
VTKPGADLALSLLGGFRILVDAAITELEHHGFDDVRPVHDFALRAIVAGADSASELGRRLSITKQSAARTIAVLEERGYVRSAPDPGDARRKRLEVTELGHTVMDTGEEIFDGLRDRWVRALGRREFERFERNLHTLVGAQPVRFDTPGWMARDGLGEPRAGG